VKNSTYQQEQMTNGQQLQQAQMLQRSCTVRVKNILKQTK